MTHSHNCLLRGLNSIVLQAPHVPSSPDTSYKPQLVRDLLFYVASWTKMVDHHHHTEETVIFPGIEALAAKPGLLSGPAHQHEEFHGGLVKLREYAERVENTPEEYRWEDMKGMIDGFADKLVEHLREEVDVFLGFEGMGLDSAGLRKTWDEAERVAKANGEIALLYDIFPCVLGCCDKTYEGGNEFPPLPGVILYAIKYWFGAYRPGAWMFNPCDFWGKPRPLLMLPENRHLQ